MFRPRRRLALQNRASAAEKQANPRHFSYTSPALPLLRQLHHAAMLTGPQIEMPVGGSLHLAAPCEIPITIEVSSPEHMSEQKEQIGLRELSLDCVFRGKSATDSGIKSATDSDLISAIPI